jgi:hypothetical protein
MVEKNPKNMAVLPANSQRNWAFPVSCCHRFLEVFGIDSFGDGQVLECRA